MSEKFPAVVITGWDDYHYISRIDVHYLFDGKERTKSVGKYSIFAQYLLDGDFDKCAALLAEYERQLPTPSLAKPIHF